MGMTVCEGLSVSGRFEPPVCPMCGNKLYKVYQDVTHRYIFSPEAGEYYEDDMEEIRVYCGFCDCDVTDLFEEGVVNFRSAS